MFRWDLWLRGVIASGIISVVSIAPVVVENGVNKAEAWALLAAFLGGVGLFCKNHPPKLDDDN